MDYINKLDSIIVWELGSGTIIDIIDSKSKHLLLINNSSQW